MASPQTSDYRTDKEDQENGYRNFVAHGLKNDPYWKPDDNDERDAPQNDLGTLSMSASWGFFEHVPKMGYGVGDFQRHPGLSAPKTEISKVCSGVT